MTPILWSFISSVEYKFLYICSNNQHSWSLYTKPLQPSYSSGVQHPSEIRYSPFSLPVAITRGFGAPRSPNLPRVGVGVVGMGGQRLLFLVRVSRGGRFVSVQLATRGCGLLQRSLSRCVVPRRSWKPQHTGVGDECPPWEQPHDAGPRPACELHARHHD